MNLSWSVLALALIGAQDQQPSQPKTPSSPITIEIDISVPKMVGSESCRRAVSAMALEPEVCTSKKTAQKSAAMAKLLDYCIEQCVSLVVDEAKAAIAELLAAQPGSNLRSARSISFHDPRMAALYVTGLEKAGLPE